MSLWLFIRKIIKCSCIVGAFLVAACTGFVLWLYFSVAQYLPDTDELRASLCPQTKTHRLVPAWNEGEIKVEVPVVPLSEMSPHVVNATLAAYDKQFKKAPPFSLLRFIVMVAKSDGRFLHCGGAIPHGVVRRVLTDIRPSHKRIAAELFTRQRLERELTKDEMLCIYLNIFYMGNGFYGVEAASQGYLGKSAAEITLAESVALVSLLHSPSRENPWTEGQPSQRSLQRQQGTLRVMLDEGWITKVEYTEALKEKIDFSSFAEREVVSWRFTGPGQSKENSRKGFGFP